MPEHLLYLAALVVSLTGLAIIDHRFRLALFLDRRRAGITLAATVGVLLVWDILGIGLGIFFVGPSPYLSGVQLGPELPLEEMFFLTLLSYNTLLLWRGGEKLWQRT